ncbi:MAG TPA: TetR family transcriptional regulator [Mycobacteriales bacterium]|nr:TetR family transcriptional regulator [Mycobacteriales bacterium]
MTTPSRRLTRAESKERTRQRLVDAATTLFLRDGFRATTLEQIGDEAGYTRGAVYSNFASKTEVGIAVIDRLYADVEERLEQALRRDDWLAAMTSWADESIGDPAWMRLELEIAALSVTDDSYLAATAARYARLRQRARELVAECLGGEVSETMAVAVLGMLLGVGAQRAADPSIPGSAWTELLAQLLGPRSRRDWGR